MDTRRKYMAIVLTSALIVAVENVVVEWAITGLQIGPFTVAAIPSLVGGFLLIGSAPRQVSSTLRSFDTHSWLLMLCGVCFIAVGVLLWFDAVGRIGAGKEAIIGGGSSEILFIVLLGAIILSERLSRIEVLGSVLVVFGVLLVLINTDGLSCTLGVGEIEAIVSSFLLAISVIITTLLLRKHPLATISGLELILSGALLLASGIALGYIDWTELADILILAALGLLPALGIVTYNAGLPKIGASLTSVLFALTGIMTVVVQLSVLLLFPEWGMKLPQSVPLALAGGSVAFAGVYLLNLKSEGGRGHA